MKGIVLAGGSGSRLYPNTLATSKQLLPVYDKPMVYYPLSVLMLAGISDILLITTPEDLPNFQRLLGDGSRFGIRLSYEIQPSPEGLAQAFIIGEKFIANDNVALILGDNLFYGTGFSTMLADVSSRLDGASIFAYQVPDPERFGIVEFDKNKKVLSLEEKPAYPRSDFAVVGLYFYDNKVVEYAKMLKPSQRGELEITDLNKIYLSKGELKVELLGRGFCWLDSGTPQSLLQASNYVSIIEQNQGIKIACLEEIAFHKGFLTAKEIIDNISKQKKNEYNDYLLKVITNHS